jgi:hypothetical protein
VLLRIIVSFFGLDEFLGYFNWALQSFAQWPVLPQLKQVFCVFLTA